MGGSETTLHKKDRIFWERRKIHSTFPPLSHLPSIPDQVGLSGWGAGRGGEVGPYIKVSIIRQGHKAPMVKQRIEAAKP